MGGGLGVKHVEKIQLQGLYFLHTNLIKNIKIEFT